MDYTKITKLSKDKISKAYFEHAKLPIEPFEVSIVYRAKYNQNGKIISLAPDTPSGTRPFDKSIKEWKALILKKAAQIKKGDLKKKNEERGEVVIPKNAKDLKKKKN